MRKISQYKNFNRIKLLSKKFPLRVFKFKRTKWKQLQDKYNKIFFKQKSRSKNQLIKNSVNSVFKRVKKTTKLNSYKFTSFIKKKYTFFNSCTTKKKKKSKERRTFFFSRRLQNKRFFSTLYDNAVKYKKSSVLKKNIYLLNALIKNEYRLDVLLWNLNLFSTCYSAVEAINNGFIFLNKKRILSNVYVKKNDILDVCYSGIQKNRAFFNLKQYPISFKFLTFVEFDAYTKSFIIVKNLDELDSDDLKLLVIKFFNLATLQN
jgi:ribosomal 50S subunit-recycling heat shock protein